MRAHPPSLLGPFGEDESPFQSEAVESLRGRPVARNAGPPGILDLVQPIWRSASPRVRRTLELAAIRQAIDHGESDPERLVSLVLAARHPGGSVSADSPDWGEVRTVIMRVLRPGMRSHMGARPSGPPRPRPPTPQRGSPRFRREDLEDEAPLCHECGQAHREHVEEALCSGEGFDEEYLHQPGHAPAVEPEAEFAGGGEGYDEEFGAVDEDLADEDEDAYGLEDEASAEELEDEASAEEDEASAEEDEASVVADELAIDEEELADQEGAFGAASEDEAARVLDELEGRYLEALAGRS